jgi:hypothetical protein
MTTSRARIPPRRAAVVSLGELPEMALTSGSPLPSSCRRPGWAAGAISCWRPSRRSRWEEEV